MLLTLYMKYIIDNLSHKYADFSGRASRTEFLYFLLFLVGVQVLLIIINTLVSGESGVSTFSYTILLFLLLTIVPSIAVTVRRLHDSGRSGWWQLISLVPFVGVIILLVFVLSRGDEGSNEYGANPGMSSAEAPTGMATNLGEVATDNMATPENGVDTNSSQV